MSSWTTKLFGAAAGIALAAATLIRPAAADETLTVRLDWLAGGYHAPFFLALDKGWFKKYGLDVKIEHGTGSASTSQLVGTGQYDIGFAALSNMAFAKDKGMPLISIGGLLRKSDLALLVPIDSPIKTPADAKGKKLVYTASSLEAPFLDAFFAKGGYKRSDVDVVAVDAAAKNATYMAGGNDGVFTSAAFTVAVVSPKRPTRPILFSDFGLALPGFGLLTTDAKLKTKGDAIKKFVSIVAGSWTYILAGHEDEGVQAMIATHPQDRLDPVIVATQLKDSMQYIKTAATEGMPIGIQAEADWAAAVKVLEDAKTIAPGSKPSSYFTNDYVDVNLVKSIGAGS